MALSCFPDCVTKSLSVQVMFYEEERDIMTEAVSPWITALHYAFQVRLPLLLEGTCIAVMQKTVSSFTIDEVCIT